MTDGTELETQGRLVFDNPSVENTEGSINTEHVEVEIHDPKEEVRALNNHSRFTQAEMEQMKKRANKQEIARYFSLKEGYFEKAVEQCKNVLCYDEHDGNFVGAWLLTEIDHWDNEKERLVILTEKELVLVQYNFITTKIEDHRKIPLVNCIRIQTSNLGYDGATFGFYRYSTHRCDQVGVRVHWNMPKVPGRFDFWNPWSKDIPFVTLMSHTSTAVNEVSPEFVNFATFQKSLIAAASSDVSRGLITDEEPILINVIFGISAMIHNQSKLGFCRDRGGVSF